MYSFTQSRPVVVEFLDEEREKHRRNEAGSSFLQLLFAPVWEVQPNFKKS